VKRTSGAPAIAARGRTRRKAGRPRDPKTDQAIGDAALALFTSGGVEAASIDAVARRAGVTRAAVYRRWPSREAMLVHALSSVRERAEAPLARERLSLDKVLEWLIATAPRELAQPNARRLLAHLVGSAPNNPSLMRSYWHATLGPRWRAFGELLRETRDPVGRPAADSFEADTLADIIAGALLWRAVVRPGRHDAAELGQFLADVLRLLGFEIGTAVAAGPTISRRKSPSAGRHG
jgi:AcrR family transcriptional regulator